jgi:hypothetical protein
MKMKNEIIVDWHDPHGKEYHSIYGDLTWLDNYENIWKVGMWLAEDKLGWGWAKDNLAYYFEKPYKYTDEYLEWREYIEHEKE